MRVFSINNEESVSYIVCGHLISENGFLHQRRRFDENVLIMVTEGTLFITSGDYSHEVSKGMFVLLPAGELHFGTRESEGRLSYFWVHFNAEFAPYGNDSDKGIKFPERGVFAINGRTSVLFHSLSDISFEDDSRSRAMCRHSLIMLLLELSKDNDNSTPNILSEIPVTVRSAMEWVYKNYYREISVSEVARKFGYTPDYFSSLFKKSTGISFTSFINSVRIRASKALLSNYGVSIREIAYSCGFPDEKYFMRVFKNSEGITPSQYRNISGKAYINEQ